MRAALTLARKDLLRSARDRSALAVAILAPLLLAFILNAVLPDDELGITYGVVNQDTGDLGAVFDDQVLSGVREFAEVRTLESVAQAERLAEDDEIAAAFVIPEGFSDAVTTGGSPAIEVIANPASDVGAPIARSIAEGFADELNAVGLSIATVATAGGASPDQALIERVRRAAQQATAAVSVRSVKADDREFDTNTFFAAGMAVFFLFFTTQFAAQSLLRERREGTLARLLAAPMSPSAIVIGKALFMYVLGVFSMVVLAVASSLLLDASWGDALGVALIILAAVFAAMGVQSLATTLARTEEQAGSYGAVIALTLGLLGGTFFPLSQGPPLLATISLISPHAWIMRGLGDLSGGAGGPADVVVPVLVLLAFGATTGGLALARARRIVLG